MRYTKFFGKTVKSLSSQIKIPSHRFLLQSGFIRESAAGRYFLLPLGLRVKNKIVAIIREEMNRAGALEMTSPILHPLELWQESNRDTAGNFGLMCVQDRRGAKFALGGTAEEMFVDVVRKFSLSYKDLPLNLYQFSPKFRDELRARGGLLRVREFTMKDAYSFDCDVDSFTVTYDLMGQAYNRIFERLGLKIKAVPAGNGYMGGEYAHEYVVDCTVGETKYLVSEDSSYCAHQDVATFALPPLNLDEALQPLQTVAQPKWVTSIDDMARHYQQPKTRFLKTVVYKHDGTGQLVIAIIRGDLAVNKAKLEQAINAHEQLTEATTTDLARFNLEPEHVHAWGHDGIETIADSSLKTGRNFIGGKKTKTTEAINVNYGRDFIANIEADIALAQPGYYTVDSLEVGLQGKKLIEKRGIEVGNIFQLGQHYSAKMAAVFQTQNGLTKPYYMGCYGIGIERTMQAIAEIYHDDRGLIWPATVAPFQVHLLSLNQTEAADHLYNQLQAADIDVLYDDRAEVSPGAKFADADLIGCPVRLVISKRTQDKVEWKRRDQPLTEMLTGPEVIDRLSR